MNGLFNQPFKAFTKRAEAIGTCTILSRALVEQRLETSYLTEFAELLGQYTVRITGEFFGLDGFLLSFLRRSHPLESRLNSQTIGLPRYHDLTSSQKPSHSDFADALDVRAISGIPRLRTRNGTWDVTVLILANSSMQVLFTWRAHALAFIFGRSLMNALLASKLPEAADECSQEVPLSGGKRMCQVYIRQMHLRPSALQLPSASDRQVHQG